MRCKFDHGHGDDKRYLWKGAGDSKYSSGNGKRRKRKSPSTKRAPASHEAAEALAAKQLENRGVAGLKKNGGAATLENGGVAELFGPGHVLMTRPGDVLLIGQGMLMWPRTQ
jgi:hypothetical protein